MFIYSVKASNLRLFAIITLSITVILTLIFVAPSKEAIYVSSDGKTVVYTNAKTNEKRKEFLKNFGWEVSENPVEEQDFTVPEEFDSVFNGYNNLQKLQGLDLSKYKHKKVTRFKYQVLNYDGYSGNVYATLFIYRGKIIGGDISSENSDGFIHGFSENTHL